MTKKNVTFILILLSFYTTYSQSKIDSIDAKTILLFKAYPLQYLAGEYRGGFDVPFFRNFCLELEGGYVYGVYGGEIDGDPAKFSSLSEDPYHGYTVRIGVKYYWAEEDNLKGYYFSFVYFYKYYYSYETSYIAPPITSIVNTYGYHLLIGKTFNYSSKWSSDVYLGVGYRKISNTYDLGQPGTSYNNGINYAAYISPQMGITIEYKLQIRR